MATLGYGSAMNGGSITDVGEIRSVGFSLSADTADTTSTASKYSAAVPTTIKSNTIFVTVLFNGNNGGDAQKFVEEFKQKRISTWTIAFSSGVFQSNGYVSSVTVAAPYDHVIQMDVAINLTGEPTFQGN